MKIGTTTTTVVVRQTRSRMLQMNHEKTVREEPRDCALILLSRKELGIFRQS